MRRLTRGRAATDDEATPQASAASDPVSVAPDDAQQGGVSAPANGSVPAAQSPEEQRTAVLAEGDETKAATDATVVAPPSETEPAARDLPAGVDPATLADVPTSARRGRLRRRLRYLRAVREVLLRDLGGFYLEAQRTEEGPEAYRRLLDAKAGRVGRLDEEVRELEARLQEERPQTTHLRQPGLGGTCPQCGELHGSDARFCSRCGTPLGRRPSAPRPASTPAPSAAGDEPKATTASLWGRPKRPAAATSDPTVAGPGATVADEPARPGALFAGGGPKGTGANDSEPAATSGGNSAATSGDTHGGEPAATSGDARDATSGDERATTAGDEPAPTGSERS